MELYRKTSHTVFDLKYHLVWCTKYRKPIPAGNVGYRVRAPLVKSAVPSALTFSVAISPVITSTCSFPPHPSSP